MRMMTTEASFPIQTGGFFPFLPLVAKSPRKPLPESRHCFLALRFNPNVASVFLLSIVHAEFQWVHLFM